MNTDPSGLVVVSVWMAAFISPPSITFDYPFIDPSGAGIDRNAVWHGDGRGFFNGGSNYPKNQSRVWYLAEFDTNMPSQLLNTNPSNRGVNYTEVSYTDRNGVPSLRRATASHPSPISYSYNPSRQTITMTVDEGSANPLVGIAPNIDLYYRFVIDLCGGTVSYRYNHDDYPWHEMVMSVNGSAILFQHDPPRGVFQNPFDLPPGRSYRGRFGPMRINGLAVGCRTNSNPVTSYLPDGLSVGCV